jgi:hypothetical protein
MSELNQAACRPFDQEALDGHAAASSQPWWERSKGQGRNQHRGPWQPLWLRQDLVCGRRTHLDHRETFAQELGQSRVELHCDERHIQVHSTQRCGDRARACAEFDQLLRTASCPSHCIGQVARRRHDRADRAGSAQGRKHEGGRTAHWSAQRTTKTPSAPRRSRGQH